MNFNIDIIIYNNYINNGWKRYWVFTRFVKIPSVGARGVNAIYEEVKKQGKAYDNKTKTGFTLAKIKEWYESREKVQTHKRGTGYHSFTPERPKQQFQIDLIMMPKAWRNNKNMYALVCIDIFTKKADMEPMKDKEATTCNKAMRMYLVDWEFQKLYTLMKVQNLPIINLFSS